MKVEKQTVIGLAILSILLLLTHIFMIEDYPGWSFIAAVGSFINFTLFIKVLLVYAKQEAKGE